MDGIRITGVQMPVSRKLDDNLPVIVEHILASDADFILFPEMSLTGYHGEFNEQAARAASRKIAAACRQSYITALIGTGRTEAGEIYIQTAIFSDEGDVVGTHNKLVPTKADRAFCAPGYELNTFVQKGVRFGCLIGNDLWVAPGGGPYPDPRLSYQLGERGAQVILHSNHSGTDASMEAYYESNLLLRAREAGVYIVTVNAADPNGAVNCPTGIVSPRGEWLVQCPRTGTQTFTLELDIETDEDAA